MSLLRHKDINFIFCLLITIGIAMTSLQEKLDNFFYDLIPSPSESEATDVVLIDIDEKSLAALGRWPWPRELHAQLLASLYKAEIGKLAYNIAFIDIDAGNPIGDDKLVKALNLFDTVTLPLFPENGQMLYPFRDKGIVTNAVFGHVDIPLDSDGQVRRAYLKAGLDTPSLPAFGLAAIQDAQVSSHLLPGRMNQYSHLGIKRKWIRDYEVLIPNLAIPHTFSRVSFVDALENQDLVNSLKGKTVFVGTEAIGLEAKYLTSQGVISSTTYQAILFDSLQSRSLLTPILSIWGLSYALLLITIIYSTLFLFSGRKVLQTLFLIGSISLLSLPVIAIQNSYWLPISPAAGGLIFCLLLWLFQAAQNYAPTRRNDTVTALANLRMFNETLETEWELSVRKKIPLSVLFIEIDYFKRFVDTFGVDRGDWVMARISPLLTLHKRKHRDLVARYDEQHLALILPLTPNNVAMSIADKIRKDVESLDIEHVGTKHCHSITTSIGVATYKGEANYSKEALIMHARTACNEAQKLGGNRVINTLRDAVV